MSGDRKLHIITLKENNHIKVRNIDKETSILLVKVYFKIIIVALYSFMNYLQSVLLIENVFRSTHKG